MSGKVYLVGAGPGDLGLMTVKGLELLRSADTVVFDALVSREILDECKNAELIDVGKRGGNHKRTQDEINELLVGLALSGKNVVRLKGGDPFLFGRGAEEAAELRRAGAEVHVVPGVSSSISVPELAGIPVTHRDHTSIVTMVTGHERADREGDRVEWENLAKDHGTIVVLMGMSNSERISNGLIKGGMDPETPAAVITDGSTEKQRVETTTISRLGSSINEKGLKAPGIIVIGSVVGESKLLGDMR